MELAAEILQNRNQFVAAYDQNQRLAIAGPGDYGKQSILTCCVARPYGKVLI